MPSEKRRTALFRDAAQIVLCDGAALVGVGLVSYGAWLIDEAIGFIVLGSLLIVGSVLVARRQ
jgi:divalent metal cation (Fe/Co/Zn/Cd) transporter